MQILVAILALSFLIIVHEFGHFIVAKLSGIKVLEFSLFMGPKLFGIQRGETLYSIRLVPLGGYVKMEGEEQESDDERAYNKKPKLIRAAVIVAGPLMNLIAAIIIIAIVFGMNGYKTTRMGVVLKDSPAYNAGIEKGDELISYDGNKIYSPFDYGLFSYATKGKENLDIKVRKTDGTIKTYELTPMVIPKDRYLLGYSPVSVYGSDSNVVEKVTKDTPAAKAGLQKGDKIKKMNDVEVATFQDIMQQLVLNQDKPLEITYIRGQDEITSDPVIPYQIKTPEQYDIGIGFSGEKPTFAGVAKESLTYTYSTARSVIYSIIFLIQQKVSLQDISGPVGIVTIIGDAVQQEVSLGDKISQLLGITAFISVNLGVMNLIPFPALDGSKLLLILIEAVRRKALAPEKEALITLVGFVLLILLMIFATSNDIIRIFGG